MHWGEGIPSKFLLCIHITGWPEVIDGLLNCFMFFENFLHFLKIVLVLLLL